MLLLIIYSLIWASAPDTRLRGEVSDFVLHERPSFTMRTSTPDEIVEPAQLQTLKVIN